VGGVPAGSQNFTSPSCNGGGEGVTNRVELGSEDGSGGGGGSSPTMVFFKTLFTLPSTGPGSCLAVFADAVKGPLKQTGTAARNKTKYIAPVAPLLPGAAAQLGSMDPNSMYTYTANADGTVTAVLSANAIVATTVAAAVAQGAQAAIKATPQITLGAIDLALLNGVVKEASAALKGQCKP